MKKLTLYRKGGKLYYKRGGKMCLYEGGGPVRYRKPIPQYQYGNDIEPIDVTKNNYQVSNPYVDNVMDQSIDPVSNNSTGPKKKGSMSDIGTYANYANMALSAIPKDKKTYGDSTVHSNALSPLNTEKQSQTHQQVSSAVPIWGQVKGASDSLLGAINQQDEYGIDKSVVGTAVQGALDPSSVLDSSIDLWSQGDVGGGFANLATFGQYEQMKKRGIKAKADKERAWQDNRNSMFENEATTQNQNTGIYAKQGADIRITPYNSMTNPNAQYTAEVEDGELILGDGIGQLRHGGNSTSSMVSQYAVKLNGDKHGQDTDGDGQEGIPVVAKDGMYVASNYLGLDGKIARGKNKKTVAKSMEPLVESLAKAEAGDAYNSNDQLVKHQLRELQNMKAEAESNKAAEELKKMLGKKDRNMAEISQFIQENAEYLMQQEEPSPEGLPQMQQDQMQSGGKLKGPIGRDIGTHATDELGVPQQMVDNAKESTDVSKVNFSNPNYYEGSEGQEYETESTVNNRNISPTDNEIVVEDLNRQEDYREGESVTENTLGEDAGKSQYTGTSNLIQEKMKEVLDPNIFSDDGGLSKEWINKGVQAGIPRYELENARRQSITDGDVGSWLGEKMQEAYGAQSIGKDTPTKNLDAGVRDASSNLYSNEQLNWANDIITDIKSNDNMLPSQYSNLPDNLKNTMLDLARSGKQAHEGKFDQSLKNAYREANVSDTQEVARQGSATYESSVDEGSRLNRNTDLSTNEKAGKIKSFSDAFRYARNSDDLADEPYFTYKGKKYSKKTRSEDPELARQSDKSKASEAGRISNEQSTQPTSKTIVKPQEIEMRARNPKNRLKAIMRKKRGGMMKYQPGGTIDKNKAKKIAYLNELAKTDPARARALAAEWAGPKPFTMGADGSMVTKGPKIMPIIDNTAASFQARRNAASDAYVAPVKSVGSNVLQNAPNNRMSTPSVPSTLNYGAENVTRERNVMNANQASPLYKGQKLNVPSQDEYFSDDRKDYQEGGQIEQDPNASNQHMQQMLQGEEGMEPGMEPNMNQGMDPATQEQGQGQVPQQIMELSQGAQQAFMQLPPEMQEQVLQLPPDQMEIAIMNIIQQMMGAQQGQAPAQEGPGQSQVPQDVINQMG